MAGTHAWRGIQNATPVRYNCIVSILISTLLKTIHVKQTLPKTKSYGKEHKKENKQGC